MIDVNELEYRYPATQEPALKKISFQIDKGEVFGFLGPSGSGKSTTQKILFRLLNGYTGSAQIAGKEVSNWGKELYQKIGVGFELPNHYLKLSAIENLNFFRAFYPHTTDPLKLLELVGLGADAHKKVADFSKGMKMRLNFIRAIMHDPEILFLDEPTSGLDPVNARVIKDIIVDQKQKGKTIFITTHQMHDADELCDRVAFISEGKICALDTPSRLKIQGSKRTVEVTVKGDPQTHLFQLEGLGENTAFNGLLKSSEIETIHSKEATLDDIFIKITGKTLT